MKFDLTGHAGFYNTEMRQDKANDVTPYVQVHGEVQLKWIHILTQGCNEQVKIRFVIHRLSDTHISQQNKLINADSKRHKN